MSTSYDSKEIVQFDYYISEEDGTKRLVFLREDGSYVDIPLGGEGEQGPRGFPGPPGPSGDDGAPGTSGTSINVVQVADPIYGGVMEGDFSSVAEAANKLAQDNALEAAHDLGGAEVLWDYGDYWMDPDTLIPDPDSTTTGGIIIRGQGPAATRLHWGTDSGVGHAPFIWPVRSQQQAIAIKNLCLIGPGGDSDPGDIPALMSGLLLGAGCNVEDVQIKNFYSGVECVSNHGTMRRVDIAGCYYGAYFAESDGQGGWYFEDCNLDAQTFACIAVHPSNVLDSFVMFNGRCGHSPYSYYREAGVGNGFMLKALLLGVDHEWVGNGWIYAEDNGSIVNTSVQRCTISNGPSGMIVGRPNDVPVKVKSINGFHMDEGSTNALDMSPSPTPIGYFYTDVTADNLKIEAVESFFDRLAARSEKQTISTHGSGGTWKVGTRIADGWTTDQDAVALLPPIPTNAALTAALESLTDIANGDVAVQVVSLENPDKPGAKISVAFQGTKAAMNVPQLHVDGALLTWPGHTPSIEIQTSSQGFSSGSAVVLVSGSDPNNCRITTEKGTYRLLKSTEALLKGEAAERVDENSCKKMTSGGIRNGKGAGFARHDSGANAVASLLTDGEGYLLSNGVIAPLTGFTFDEASPTRVIAVPANRSSIGLSLDPAASAGVLFNARVVALSRTGSIPWTIVDAKGDILVGTGDNAPARKAVGADHTILSPDSAQADNFVYRNLVQIDAFTTAGTFSYTKPAWAKKLELYCIGGGGGGGSGRKGLAGTIRCGGGGGGGGGFSSVNFNAPDWPGGGGPSVIVGAKGTGGAAQTGNSLDGNNGVGGGNSYIGVGAGTAIIRAGGGFGGSGGTNAAGAAGGSGSGGNNGGAGGAASTSGAAGTAPAFGSGFVGGGGSGGGITTGNAASTGGQGGQMNQRSGTTLPSAGAIGSNGGPSVDLFPVSAISAHGGGGGGSSITGNAGDGGAGAAGSGGGGGGAALDATGNSGKGGDGGDGKVVIIAIG